MDIKVQYLMNKQHNCYKIYTLSTKSSAYLSAPL